MIPYKLILKRQGQEISTNCSRPKLILKNKLAPCAGVKNLSLPKDSWSKIFKSLKNVCKDTKLKEFQFKFIHRVVITKKELFRFGITTDDECLYCGDKDSIEHTFVECPFTRTFVKKVLQWFNEANSCQICPTTEELFGVFSSIHGITIKRKFNYTTLAMRHYIYSNKTNNKAIYISHVLNEQGTGYEHIFSSVQTFNIH